MKICLFITMCLIKYVFASPWDCLTGLWTNDSTSGTASNTYKGEKNDSRSTSKSCFKSNKNSSQSEICAECKGEIFKTADPYKGWNPKTK